VSTTTFLFVVFYLFYKFPPVPFMGFLLGFFSPPHEGVKAFLPYLLWQVLGIVKYVPVKKSVAFDT